MRPAALYLQLYFFRVPKSIGYTRMIANNASENIIYDRFSIKSSILCNSDMLINSGEHYDTVPTKWLNCVIIGISWSPEFLSSRKLVRSVKHLIHFYPLIQKLRLYTISLTAQ